MNTRAFHESVRECFAQALDSSGFDCRRSRGSTFYRERGECWHFVLADPLRSGSRYDVKVFATSPRIDPSFEDRFPDDLGIPSDVRCHLGPKGVGMDAEFYPCRTADGLARSFESTVRARLSEVAVPFLDGISSLETLLPTIQNPGLQAIALFEVGRRAEAHAPLEAERTRLLSLGSDVDLVAKRLRRIEVLLATYR